MSFKETAEKFYIKFLTPEERFEACRNFCEHGKNPVTNRPVTAGKPIHTALINICNNCEGLTTGIYTPISPEEFERKIGVKLNLPYEVLTPVTEVYQPVEVKTTVPTRTFPLTTTTPTRTLPPPTTTRMPPPTTTPTRTLPPPTRTLPPPTTTRMPPPTTTPTRTVPPSRFQPVTTFQPTKVLPQTKEVITTVKKLPTVQEQEAKKQICSEIPANVLETAEKLNEILPTDYNVIVIDKDQLILASIPADKTTVISDVEVLTESPETVVNEVEDEDIRGLIDVVRDYIILELSNVKVFYAKPVISSEAETESETEGRVQKREVPEEATFEGIPQEE